MLKGAKYHRVGNKEQEMPNAVIEDWDQFNAFLAAQPLCKWAAQKQQDIATGKQSDRGWPSVQPPTHPKSDNADLAAALASMA
jgi:hypothetical protein